MNDITYMKQKYQMDDSDIIEINMKSNKFKKEVKKKAKGNYCLLCGKATKNFCESHSVPRATLEKITFDGELANVNAIMGMPVISELTGLKKTGVFYNICRECDVDYFKDYENDVDKINITQKQISQIALKTNLKSTYYLKQIKAESELKRSRTYSKRTKDIYKQTYGKMIEVCNVELKNLYDDFELLKENSVTGKEKIFKLFYEIDLNYVVPIAFQSMIALIYDLRGDQINSLYEYTQNEASKYLHVSIFPTGDKTKILMFVKEEDEIYNNFINDFLNLEYRKQLELINYMIFLYSKEIYMNKNLIEKMEKHMNFDILDYIVKNYDNVKIRLGIDKKKAESNKIFYSLANIKNIPNVLSEEFRLENNK